MTEESQILVASGSGIQTVVPQLAAASPQVVYLDFDGAETSYNGELLTIDDIVVSDSGFDDETIAFIVETLNEQFGDDIVFTAELPQTDEYSTIYIGVTSAFDAYGDFLGLAETIDSGNKIHNDNAFVFLNSTASTELVTSVIAHETEHIVSGMEHEGEGLDQFAHLSATGNHFIIHNGEVEDGSWVSWEVQDSYFYGTYIWPDPIITVSKGGTIKNLVLFKKEYENLRIESEYKSVVFTGYIEGGGYASNVALTGGVLSARPGAHLTDFNFYSGTASVSGAIFHGTNYVKGSMTVGQIDIQEDVEFHVSNGGTMVSTTVNSGGRLYIGSNGMAISTTVSSGGSLFVTSDGMVTSTTIISGGRFSASSGVTAVSTIVSKGGYLQIESDGTALQIVEDGGYVKADSGASVTFASNVISNLSLENNSATLHSGTTVISANVSSGGMLYIYNGGIVNTATVDSGGDIYVSKGGTANNVLVNSAGYMTVKNSGIAVSAILTSFGHITVSSGGTATSSIVNFSGHLHANSGGLVESTSVSSGGFLYANSGGSVVGASVESDGNLHVRYGGIAHSTIVSSGASFTVFSGGTATDVVAESGAILSLTLAKDTYIEGTIAGSAFSIRSNVASDLTLNPLTYLYVESGGTASVTTVSSGGNLDVSSGGMAVSTLMSYGGDLNVYGGGTAISTIMIGYKESSITYLCHLNVSSGGTAVSTTASNGGWIQVYDGGTALSTIMISEGELKVYSGGTANNTILETGGELIVYGGTVNHVTVSSGGTLWVEEGTVSDIILSEGCDFHFFIASNTYIQGNFAGSDFEIDMKDPFLSGYVIEGGVMLHVLENASATNLIVKGSNDSDDWNPGWLLVSGGKVTNTTADAYCVFEVEDGGVANSTMIKTDGRLEVYSGGTANDTIVSSQWCGWTGLQVFSGGTANRSILKYEGLMVVSSGGTANSVTVDSGGLMGVYDGGVLHGDVIIGGRMYLEGTANASNAEVTFDVAQRTTSDDVIVNDITRLSGGTYSVSVAADQTNGQYKLAGNASTFNQNLTLTVKNTNLTATLTKGSKTTVGGKDYTLSVVSGNLCLTVAGDGLPAPLNPSGNGTKLSWSVVEGASGYVVEYSQDNFATVISVETETIGTEHYNVGAGTWQWRVRAKEGAAWAVGNNIIVSSAGTTPTVVTAVEDDIKDTFFVRVQGTWDSAYRARHMGVHGGWEGTGEKVVFGGENRFGDIFQGCADENILLLTDDANGDALFIDDIYTESKNDLAKTQARLANIKEIRAGAGNDIVDLTSDKFDYTGSGLSIHGGLGDDTIWANNGDNTLFGDAGNDRLVGASGNDIIVGGIGDDSLHGGGGDDIFAFGGDWGHDSVEQLANGKVTLWFENGSLDKWNASTLTYTDGENRVKVSGVAATNVTLKFGDDGSEQYGKLLESGAFDEFGSEKIFENKNTRGMLA